MTGSLLALLVTLLPTVATANEGAPTDDHDDERPKVTLRPSGHVKMFATALLPYDAEFLPDQPVGQGFVDGRLNLEARVGERVSIELAHAVTATLGGGAGGAVGIGTGVAPNAPQLVDLGWEAFDEEGSSFKLIGRTDRLMVKAGVPGVDVTIGRQPVSFGQGRFFTPLDLVNPFTPAVIDTEYKPGVDGVRVDGFVGSGLSGTAVVTWADQPVGSDQADGEGLEKLTGALYGQGTVGITDIGLFVGGIRGDLVVGSSLATSVGAVGLYGDTALTFPFADDEEDAPFVRTTFGVSWLPHPRLTISGEVYVQTLGSTDPGDALTLLQKDRYARGEVWLTGVAYAGLSASYEVTPLIFVSVATFGNLTDPSAFVSASVSWSIADNAELLTGAYVGAGARPDEELVVGTPPNAIWAPIPRSEFGLYPSFGFLQVRTYF